MKGRPWAKFDVGTPRDPKVATLTSDAARWAFVVVILAAKEQDRPGGFESLDHLQACVSFSVAENIPELIERGLLAVDPEGGIHVAKWTKYQIDPTKAERSARYRDKIKATHAPRTGTTESIADIVRRTNR